MTKKYMNLFEALPLFSKTLFLKNHYRQDPIKTLKKMKIEKYTVNKKYTYCIFFDFTKQEKKFVIRTF